MDDNIYMVYIYETCILKRLYHTHVYIYTGFNPCLFIFIFFIYIFCALLITAFNAFFLFDSLMFFCCLYNGGGGGMVFVYIFYMRLFWDSIFSWLLTTTL